MKIYYLIILFAYLFVSCGTDSKSDAVVNNAKSNTEIQKTDKTDVASDDPVNEKEDGRKTWQKPDLVLQKLGDVTGMTVADIGAGTGYFSFRLLRKAEKVIAIDIDPVMTKFMDAYSKSYPEEFREKLETRLATPDNPMLKDNEADLIIIVNTFAYIDNKVTYLSNLKKKLKPGGRLAIIDFKMKRMDIQAPPFESRILLHDVEEQVYEAGFNTVSTDDTSLEYQYFVFGQVD
jgi:ubiquinone/menaquinone biosynthesis C-methylase UbiE